MTDKYHEAPSYLSDTSKEIFKFYTGKSIKTPGQVALLIRGLDSLDLAIRAAETLREEGLIVTSKRSGMSRAHPCIAIQKEATAAFFKIAKLLGFESSRAYVAGAGWSDLVD